MLAPPLRTGSYFRFIFSDNGRALNRGGSRRWWKGRSSAAMGGQSSKDYPEDDVGDGKKKKKGGIMNCHCGKGRDDQDEVVSDPRTGKGTRLSEEEWAQVKTGKLQGIPGAPDLLAEEAVSSHRRHRKRKDDEAEETEMLVAGSTHTRHAEPPSAPSGSHLRLPNEQSGAARFAANDRVKCACTRWYLPPLKG